MLESWNRNWPCSVIADHCKHELFDSCTALDLSARHGAENRGRHRGGLAVMLVPAPVYSLMMAMVQFSFVGMIHEILMHVPQLALELFEGRSIGFPFRIALEMAAPSIAVLPEDVSGGMHQAKYSETFQMSKRKARIDRVRFFISCTMPSSYDCADCARASY